MYSPIKLLSLFPDLQEKVVFLAISKYIHVWLEFCINYIIHGLPIIYIILTIYWKKKHVSAYIVEYHYYDERSTL